MSRIAPIDLKNPAADVAPQLDAVRAKMGKVPNMIATLAQSPVALNAYLSLGDVAAKGTLSAKERERIALTVGQANDCEYCVSAHSLVGKLTGLNETEILAARRAQGTDARTSAITGLADAIVRDRGLVATPVLDQARAAGLTEAELLEVLTVTVANILTNYANHLIQTDLDFPKAAPLAA